MTRVAEFLGVPFPDAKKAVTLERMSFSSMKGRQMGAGKLSSTFYRKGEVKDWERHFTPAQNAAFDKMFVQMCGDLKICEPYLPGGRLSWTMDGSGTTTPCWLEPGSKEQVMKREPSVAFI